MYTLFNQFFKIVTGSMEWTKVTMLGSDMTHRIALLLHHPEFLDAVMHHVWMKWSPLYIHGSGIVTEGALLQLYAAGFTVDSEVYVLFTGNCLKTLIGFCFVDAEDSGVMPWLTPWLANVE